MDYILCDLAVMSLYIRTYNNAQELLEFIEILWQKAPAYMRTYICTYICSICTYAAYHYIMYLVLLVYVWYNAKTN